MSKRSDLYYKECRENFTGKYYKNYPKKNARKSYFV